MSYASAFAPWIADKKEKITQATWGHLAPEKNKTYTGQILFTTSAYESGTRRVIDSLFDNDLGASPWLYDAMDDLINELDCEEPGCYLAKVTFRNYKWRASVKTIHPALS